jgi:hypothetical protein
MLPAGTVAQDSWWIARERSSSGVPDRDADVLAHVARCGRVERDERACGHRIVVAPESVRERVERHGLAIRRRGGERTLDALQEVRRQAHRRAREQLAIDDEAEDRGGRRVHSVEQRKGDLVSAVREQQPRGRGACARRELHALSREGACLSALGREAAAHRDLRDVLGELRVDRALRRCVEQRAQGRPGALSSGAEIVCEGGAPGLAQCRGRPRGRERRGPIRRARHVEALDRADRRVVRQARRLVARYDPRAERERGVERVAARDARRAPAPPRAVCSEQHEHDGAHRDRDREEALLHEQPRRYSNVRALRTTVRRARVALGSRVAVGRSRAQSTAQCAGKLSTSGSAGSSRIVGVRRRP